MLVTGQTFSHSIRTIVASSKKVMVSLKWWENRWVYLTLEEKLQVRALSGPQQPQQIDRFVRDSALAW